MERDEKALWNRKYSEGSHSSLVPDPFLVRAYSEFVAGRQPGNALDVAGGAGRHALWLAERGWNVNLVDISETGIKLARKNLTGHLNCPITRLPNYQIARSPMIKTEVRDLQADTDLGDEIYDLILVFFFLQRSLFPALISALKPGSLLIYKTYTIEQLGLSGGPGHPMHLLNPGELRQAFASLEIVFYQEKTQEKAVAELVARKP